MPLSKVHLGIGQININISDFLMYFLVILFAISFTQTPTPSLGQIADAGSRATLTTRGPSLVDRFRQQAKASSEAGEETPPPFHFAVLDEDTGKICILAKFDASFTITYDTKYGKQQMIDRLTTEPDVDGRCASLLDEQPVMDITWRGGFTYRLIFTKVGSLPESTLGSAKLLSILSLSMLHHAYHDR